MHKQALDTDDLTRVCKALNLATHGRSYYIIGRHSHGPMTLNPQTVQCTECGPTKIILLAAAAKAMMAGRGYAWHVGDESLGLYWPRSKTPNKREFVGASQLDSTDPLSEAQAILRVCAEALTT